MSRLAIIAGTGDLPRLIAQHSGRDVCVVLFAERVPDWAQKCKVLAARFEAIGKLLEDLRQANCRDVVFAGAMARPDLNFARMDDKSMELVASMMQGDDATLRSISRFFEREGFQVLGAHEVLSGLLVPAGVLTKAQPTEVDRRDAGRGMKIVEALGSVDVGQAAVVAQGICLGVESIQGTDALLQFVADTRSGSGGVLCKAAKPGQDMRMDMPAVGAQTIINAHRAGLAGVAVQAGAVMALDMAGVVEQADRLGLFFWGREGD